MFKRGDIVVVKERYSHPLSDEHPAKRLKAADLAKDLVGEIIDVHGYYVTVWFPSLQKYTSGTYDDHYRKL